MTTDELMRIICTEPKFYAGVMNHSTAFSIKRRWKNGTVKQSTLIWFFAKFGYEPSEIEWQIIKKSA